jgi:hypothetical protein
MMPRALAALLVSCILAAADPALPPPVAAWDVVPHQVLGAPLQVGVVAFHRLPLSVVFRIAGPPGAAPVLERTVAEPTLNAHTGVWEYWCTVDPAAIPDGPFEVQARVEVAGHAEAAKELEPLALFANATGGLPAGREVVVDGANGDDAAAGDATAPLRSLKAGLAAAGAGGTVRLRAGRYAAQALGGSRRERWTTITADTGLKPEQVEITAGRPGFDKLRFAGVSLVAEPEKPGYNTILAGENGKHVVWFDGCRMVCSKGREWGAQLTGNNYPSYITGGEVIDLADGPSARLMRGLRMRRICSDAFTGARVAIDCTVEVIDRGTTEAHPDFVQSHVGDKDAMKSFILYNCRGLRCGAQGFFGLNVRDSAFVNCLFVKEPADSALRSQYVGRMENVLFLHLTLPNQHWHWRGTGPLTRDVLFANGVVPSMDGGDPEWMAGITVQDSHIVKATKVAGDGLGEGPARFADPAAGDYRPAAGSPLVGTARRFACVPADIDGKPWPAGAVNRGCLRTAETTP